MTSRVSILIPVHNGEGYVGKAIRSVLAQDFQDYEVVVLDDGSTDASARVARAFGDPRVRVYRREEHEGIPATRNHLLIAATAPLIAWLDADDVAYPERLQKQLAFLERHSDIAAVACGFVEIDPHRQTLKKHSLPQAHDDLVSLLLQGKAMPASTLVLRRQAIDAAKGLREDLAFGSEHDLLLKIAEKARIAALPEPLVKCRVHAKAVSYTRRMEFRGGVEEARRRAVLRRYHKPLLIADPEALEAAIDPAELLAAEGVVVEQVPASDRHPTTEAAVEADGLARDNSATAAVDDDQPSLFEETATADDDRTATAEVDTPEVDTAEVDTAEVDTADVEAAEVDAETAEVDTAEVDTAEVDTAEVDTAVVDTAEVDTAEVETAEVDIDELDDETDEAETADAIGQETDELETEAAEVTAQEADELETEAAEVIAQEIDEVATDDESDAATQPDAAAEAPTADSEPSPLAASAEEGSSHEALVAVVIEATGRQALEAVRSVLDQSMPDFSLAVVATGADEGLLRGLEILGDRRVLLLAAPKASRAHSLNIGVLATRSRYVAYLNETSHYRPDHLEQLTAMAEAERLGFVYADLGLATTGIAGSAVSGTDFDAERLLHENYIPTETVLHRRDLLHEVGLFNEGLTSGMEWELWVYLTRIAPARRHAEATVDRVVGGARARNLIPPSPARVRRFLVERFSGAAASAELQPAIQMSHDDLAEHGDAVARAQERFKRGDWAGAASELVDAASRPFNALGQLFSPRYPERDIPTSSLSFSNGPNVESRPRGRVEQGIATAGATRGAEVHSTNLGSEPRAANSRFQLGREPGQPAIAQPMTAAVAGAPTGTDPVGSDGILPGVRPPNVTAPRSGAGNTWMLMQARGIGGTGRSRANRTQQARPVTAGRHSTAFAQRPGVTPAGGSVIRSRRKAMSTLIQTPPCPMCGHVSPTLAHRAGWYRVLDCDGCGLGFSFPRLDPNLAARFFSDRRATMVPPNVRSVDDLTATPYDRSRELSWVKRHVTRGKLIDIGCAWGYGVAQARALGFDASGVELSKSLARTARERFDVEVFEAELEQLELPASSIDAVLCVHTMQHMLDPRAFLTDVHRVLSPGGVLAGSMPNFDSYLRESLGRRWKWLDPESQSFHFRPSALARQLEEVGFEVELWTSEGLYGDTSILEQLSSEDALQMARAGRGSELGFVAKKAKYR